VTLRTGDVRAVQDGDLVAVRETHQSP
jgi:hypothetical protein